MRLQVFLSHNGVCSRREAMTVIQAGRVTVNGKVIHEPSTAVEGHEIIAVDGKIIEVKSYTYIALHKPVGVTTTKDDPHAKETVMDLLPKQLQHVVPVGRLDKDSSGLLLLTNDGNLAHHLTHPSFHQSKTYEVVLTGHVNKQKIDQLKVGIVIEGVKTLPCTIKDVVYNGDQTNRPETSMTVILRQGRKRQIRLMANAVGHHVIELKRVAIGSLTLANLAVGKWRMLTSHEVKALM